MLWPLLTLAAVMVGGAALSVLFRKEPKTEAWLVIPAGSRATLHLYGSCVLHEGAVQVDEGGAFDVVAHDGSEYRDPAPGSPAGTSPVPPKLPEYPFAFTPDDKSKRWVIYECPKCCLWWRSREHTYCRCQRSDVGHFHLKCNHMVDNNKVGCGFEWIMLERPESPAPAAKQEVEVKPDAQA